MDWNAWSNFAESLMLGVADASLRAVALATMALVMALLLRRNSTAQHAIWTVVVMGMLALPAIRPLVPVTHVYALKHSEVLRQAIESMAEPAAEIAVVSATSVSAHGQVPSPSRLWPLYLATAYIIGVLLLAARMRVRDIEVEALKVRLEIVRYLSICIYSAQEVPLVSISR